MCHRCGLGNGNERNSRNSTDPEKWKAYYYLLQIAFILVQLLERGSLLKQLAAELGRTPLPEFARVFNAEHRIEQCLQRAKGEAGLSHYQVRTWRGWHHHQTLSLIATWFLTQEARRGKNMDPRADGAAAPLVYRGSVPPGTGLRPNGLHLPHQHPPPETDRASAALLLEEETQPYAPVAG